ncbi:guanine nucleotide-releasing factor 2 isoform X5 [Drosophila ananassae]|uniref:guanine nucleotide-releasing factor 2 isoform X5 n=1 Tax=Drosophila ananassae TaxID=7217 RepID=UPI0013A5D528|nr:guanine nucleotide-releasing factor 2 isoform X5 [Drosophila ananassae]
MPEFDESFLRDCALAERWGFYSYTLKPTPPTSSHDDDDHHHHQRHHLGKKQRQSWSPRDTNNNTNSNTSNSGNTLHSIKFHRRRKYKKLPRLASLSTPLIPQEMDVDVDATGRETSLPSTPVPLKNAVCHGSISSPSTPGTCSSGGGSGGGCSSSSNNSLNSGNSYSAAASSASSTLPPSTHHQAPGTPRGGGGSSGAPPPAPPSAGSSGHKNSLKGTKLARRARSFKDDLIEKISLMRTTNNTLGRSHSPHSPRSKHGCKPPPSNEEVQRSTQTLETHVKDISNALKHFRDVILKKKLEVLPGNGTVILETIASMYSVIQTYTLNENSATMSSATQQVYQSLGKLIKLCDEVMLSGESDECASLSNENVREVIDLLEDAVRNLVTLAQGKLKEQDQCTFRYGGAGLGGIGAAAEIMGAVTASPGITVGSGGPGTGIGIGSVASMRVSAAESAVVAQRTSLPDIALTPKERDSLEQHNVNPMRGSHSTESILRDTSPPPKPPLPNRASNPPPLPPKRRSQQGGVTVGPGVGVGSSSSTTSTSNQASPLPYAQSHNISLNSDLDCSSNISLLNYGVDHLSVRSRSPDENSQCSFDSALNHSREEEDQLRQMPKMPPALDQDMDGGDKILSYSEYSIRNRLSDGSSITQLVADLPNPHPQTRLEGEMASIPVTVMAGGQGGSGGSGHPDGGGGTTTTTVMAGGGESNTELRKAAAALTINRHSNESGFVSMKSYRTSTQSVSKRSSDYSVQSSTKSSSSNSEIAFSISESGGNSTSTMGDYQQRCTTTTSSTSTTSTGYSSSEMEQTLSSSLGILRGSSPEMAAPALPPKTGHRLTRHESAGDEADEAGWGSHRSSQSELAELRHMQHHHHPHLGHQAQLQQWHSKHHSLIGSSCYAFDKRNLEEPPPLPMKKKHNRNLSNKKQVCQIVVRKSLTHLNYRSNQRLVFQSVAFSVLAYMEICSASTRSIEQHRHTMHAYNISRNISHSQTMNIMPMSKELSPEMETPPALPPKNYKQRKTTSLQPFVVTTTPPPSPKPAVLAENGGARPDSRMATVCEELATEEPGPVLDSNENVRAGGSTFYSHQLPSEEATATASSGGGEVGQPISSPQLLDEGDPDQAVNPDQKVVTSKLEVEEDDEEDDVEEEEEEPEEMLINMLEEVDITRYLILKRKEEDGPEVKGGYIDALIVHASRVQKVADNGRHHQKSKKKEAPVQPAFSEAFITTFRTFIQPIDVIEKLTHRYTYFFCQVQDNKQKAAKETFSLLVRVVNDLTSTDLTSQLLSLLVEFVYQLVCSGQLYLAKLLRNKFVEKVTLYKEPKVYGFLGELDYGGGSVGSVVSGGGIGGSGVSGNGAGQPSLLDLKSLEIAEQMTLLDAELFQKIEIPEVLLFAKDQCEEKSPNLNKFTEHFNKMSFWARSKILRLQDAKEREKHVNKFIKIMKHLRKMNNYNSYLALLSALDSGPIRRLEWQKGITEEVSSFCTLIDSSSSFRAYRQALAETNPPCIPYIGLVLQDLTFVHVGNQDYLSKGVINFSKRWQQYNIIVNMKRFKKCAYPFRRNERIIRFFDNFKDFMGEEEMWQVSEKIKPRGRRPVNY